MSTAWACTFGVHWTRPSGKTYTSWAFTAPTQNATTNATRARLKSDFMRHLPFKKSRAGSCTCVREELEPGGCGLRTYLALSWCSEVQYSLPFAVTRLA